MTDYTITTDFGAKDSLPSGNAGKVIKGSEFTTEFTNIKTAVNSKADTAGDTFTGAVTFDAAVTLNADVTFDTDTMFVDVSANRVGIGTTAPSSLLHLESASAPTLKINDTDSTLALELSQDGSNGSMLLKSAGTLTIGVTNNSSSDALSFQTQSTERMSIDSSGNVGIGITNPDQTLHLYQGALKIESGAPRIYLTDVNHNSDYSILNDNGLFGIYDDTNTTYRLRIDASGNVGIGTTSPDSKLHVQSGGEAIRVNTANENTHMSFGGARAKFGYARIGASDLTCIQGSTGKGIVFCTDNATFGSGEKARIDTSGNLLLGKTASTFNNTAGIGQFPDGRIYITRDSGNCLYLNRTTNNGPVAAFYRGDVATNVGTISITASATSYNTSSDERLKENIADSADAGSKVDAIQIRQFNWKVDGSHQNYGVIAQELVTVAPEAVHQPEDSEEMMGVDYSKLVPMLIKEVQSLRSRVAELENV